VFFSSPARIAGAAWPCDHKSAPVARPVED